MSTYSITPAVHKSYMKQDGTIAVRIRIYYKGKSVYLPTTIVVRKDQLSRKFEIKDFTIQVRVNALIKSMQDKVNSIRFTEDTTVKDLARIASMPDRETFTLDFPTYAQKIASRHSKGTAGVCMCSVRSLCDYLGTDSFDISAITSSLLYNYTDWLAAKHGKDARCLSMYTSNIRKIHNCARREFNNEELGEILIPNPFSVFKCPSIKPAKHRTIKREVIQAMIDDRGNLSGCTRLAIDIFLISFALMGTNTPDIHSCKIRDGIVYYERTKTRTRRSDRAEMRIRLEDITNGLFNPYIKGDSFIFRERCASYKSLGHLINRGLKEWCESRGIEPITMYYARHTWATIAYSIGVDKSVINSCLCHVDMDMRVTDIYIEKDWSLLWEANRKVLETFEW